MSLDLNLVPKFEVKEVVIDDLTEVKLDGAGVFDTLMRTMKAHLDREFQQNRITGPEYSTVYLGSVQAVLQTSLEFLIQRQKIALEAELLNQQVILAQTEVMKAEAAVRLAEKQVELAEIELQIQAKNLLKIPAEIAHIEAQTALVEANTTKVPAEKAQIEAETSLVEANLTKVSAEKAHIEAQTDLVEANLTKIPAEKEQIETQTQLIGQQHTNAITENLVLQAQKCKLDAEFDLISQNVLKAGAEVALLNQKTMTERAQTTSMGVDENSVIGRQKSLYQAQTEGFKRDAEQKVAKILVDSWGIRRSTDEEGTAASPTNMLDDATIGRAVSKLLQGIGV